MTPSYQIVQFTKYSGPVLFGAALVGFIAVYVGIWWLLRYGALKLDLPVERSSHTMPTPRGGGFILAPVILTAMGLISIYCSRVDIGLITCGAFLIWLIGFFEDTRGLSAQKRLFSQFLIATLLLLSLNFFGVEIIKPGLPNIFSISVLIVTILWVVWMTNLFNFMDGINGIAGIQVIALSAGALIWIADDAYKFIFLILIFATLGFLPWNFPKAKIFLGDSGSLFFGFLFGVFSVVNFGFKGPLSTFCMVIWAGPFLFDATITLIRRAMRGENISQPHRSHFYQIMAKNIGTHWPVALLYGAIGLLGSWWVNLLEDKFFLVTIAYSCIVLFFGFLEILIGRNRI
jgi:Fuc2NAc and GlcNAc transferase